LAANFIGMNKRCRRGPPVFAAAALNALFASVLLRQRGNHAVAVRMNGAPFSAPRAFSARNA
jgi:hypothetical protein